ncbi:hypothetical protein [Nocardioides sp.]|uniref:COG4705 family protein n=1 Tax=Nocardioides sp. TaxID=35761 RepID=UPI0031FEF1E5|nr:Integral rane protein [Nocardioides sp.]
MFRAHSRTESRAPGAANRPVLNKVPEVVLLFWVVKIMSTTIGETAADFLDVNAGLGLTNTSLIMAALLTCVLVVQLRLRRYVPAAYWLAVILVSIVGTLITDNLVENAGVSLWTTTIAFSTALALTFSAWFRSERTLSIHTIVTRRRESFYWLSILFAFALGTSASDMVAEKLTPGHLTSAGIFGILIALIAVAHWLGGLDAVLSFWTAYILTRPFGASIGDVLTAPSGNGGLGLGRYLTSAGFLVVVVGAVVWFTLEERRSGDAPTAVAGS